MTWMQWSKFTGHPLVISLTLAQIHLNAAIENTIAARNLIDQLSAIIRAIAPVHREYCARRSPTATPVLTEEQCKIALAAASLVNEHPERIADEICATLKHLVDTEKQAGPPPPSVKEMLKPYPQTKTSRMRQMEAAARGGKTPLSDAIDAEGAAIDAWSPEDARRVVAEFGGNAARAAVKWGASPPSTSSPPPIFGPLTEEEVVLHGSWHSEPTAAPLRSATRSMRRRNMALTTRQQAAALAGHL